MVPSPGGRREAEERCHWGSSVGGQVPTGFGETQLTILSDEVALELGL